MDKETTLVGLLIILICASPFIIVHLNSRKRKNNLLIAMRKNAASLGEQIGPHEVLRSTAIGLSDRGEHLFSVRNTKGIISEQQADLKLYRACRAFTEGRSVPHEDGSVGAIDVVLLALTAKDSRNSDLQIELFSTEHDSFALTSEVKFAETWSRHVNDQIAMLNKKK